jgi:hypothetical protein
VNPAVVEAGQTSTSETSVSPAVQAALVGTSSISASQAPIVSPTAPISQSTNDDQQANIVDSLLADPSEDWLYG